MGKTQHKIETIKDITSDSQVNSNFPYRWSPATFIKLSFILLEICSGQPYFCKRCLKCYLKSLDHEIQVTLTYTKYVSLTMSTQTINTGASKCKFMLQCSNYDTKSLDRKILVTMTYN